jgi:hypothetical protein
LVKILDKAFYDKSDESNPLVFDDQPNFNVRVVDKFPELMVSKDTGLILEAEDMNGPNAAKVWSGSDGKQVLDIIWTNFIGYSDLGIIAGLSELLHYVTDYNLGLLKGEVTKELKKSDPTLTGQSVVSLYQDNASSMYNTNPPNPNADIIKQLKVVSSDLAKIAGDKKLSVQDHNVKTEPLLMKAIALQDQIKPKTQVKGADGKTRNIVVITRTPKKKTYVDIKLPNIDTVQALISNKPLLTKNSEKLIFETEIKQNLPKRTLLHVYKDLKLLFGSGASKGKYHNALYNFMMSNTTSPEGAFTKDEKKAVAEFINAKKTYKLVSTELNPHLTNAIIKLYNYYVYFYGFADRPKYIMTVGTAKTGGIDVSAREAWAAIFKTYRKKDIDFITSDQMKGLLKVPTNFFDIPNRDAGQIVLWTSIIQYNILNHPEDYFKVNKDNAPLSALPTYDLFKLTKERALEIARVKDSQFEDFSEAISNIEVDYMAYELAMIHNLAGKAGLGFRDTYFYPKTRITDTKNILYTQSKLREIGFDIFIVFGQLADAYADLGEDKDSVTFNSTVKILRNVQVTSVSVNYSANGEPISETYTFIFKDM